jgi:hypothetical protein
VGQTVAAARCTRRRVAIYLTGSSTDQAVICSQVRSGVRERAHLPEKILKPK